MYQSQSKEAILEAEIERLKEVNNELVKLAYAEKDTVGKRLKERVQSMALNAVDDLPSTLTGAGVALGIAVSQYPNFDTGTILEIIGFSGMGAMSNNNRNEFG